MRPQAIVLLTWVLTLGAVRADDPLRFVPKEADVVVKFDRPSALVAAIENHDLVREAYQIAGVREFYDSTNLRRLGQLLSHFEKELGKERRELFEALTGGGVVLAARFEKPGAAMLVVQAKDAKLLERFAQVLLDVVEAELARQESKEKIRKTKVEGIDALQIGSARIAVVDGAVILASEDRVLKTVLDRHRARRPADWISAVPAFQEARKSVPLEAHAWAWLNLDSARKQPGFKTGFEAGALDPNVTILFGGLMDIIRRSPFVTAHLVQEKNDWRLGVQMPRGRDGMSAIRHMIVPEGNAGSLPLLQPPRTLASFSYFIDLGQFWQHRQEIFNEKQAAALDKAEQDIAKVLLGTKLGKVLQQLGNHHRVVVAAPGKSPYATAPPSKLPAFAVVMDMRDPAVGKTINFALRGFGLVGVLASKGSVKLSEQEHAGVKLVCYHFPEDKPFQGDATGFRFNFDPCFAIVEDQLIFSSSVGLTRDLIDELRRVKDTPQPATMRTQLFATGLATALRSDLDQVVTQAILGQALAPEGARAEVERILGVVERLGTLAFRIDYDPHTFRFDAAWRRK